jgi:polypeptide N-acetylgalactosaminyltransferase
MDRLFKEYNYSVNGTDFSVRNLRRLVEVWFDEYKYLYYRKHPKRKVECGDLTEAIALRKKLNCKPFNYYIEKVAPYILDRYPIKKMAHFAYGAIQSLANKKLCITAPKDLGIARLKTCSKNLKFPSSRQNFALTWHRMIRLRNIKKGESCLSLNEIEDCHYQQQHQLLQHLPGKLEQGKKYEQRLKWFFFIKFQKTLQIAISNGKNCLSANFKTKKLDIAVCNPSDVNQKWNFGFKNLTALANWKTYGAKFL